MNWLVIAVIVLIVLATLAGAKRGLVKTVLSFASFFVSLVIMLVVREPVSDFVKDQTGIYAAIETSVSSFVEEKTQEIQAGQAQLTDKVIDSLNLPDVLTKSLEQSNSKAVYEQRGIQNIAAYITGWLTDLAFEAVCCIISFVVVWILLRIVTMVLAGIVRLPVLHLRALYCVDYNMDRRNCCDGVCSTRLGTRGTFNDYTEYTADISL